MAVSSSSSSADQHRTLTVGLVQQAISDNNKKKNWDASKQQIEALANQGCQLIMLQELHSTLYFCQEENTDNFDLAEPIPGPATDYFERIAADLDIVLVTSLFEKRAAGLYHNTAVVFDKQQGMIGKYRKMHIPDDPGFYEKFYFTPGDLGFTPIDTSVGRLGVLVCWDQWYPEAARLVAMAGAEILLYPTAIGWDKNDTQAEQKRQFGAWQTIQRGHAIANSLPVMVANRTGFEASPIDGDPGIQFWGQSFIAGPQGEILASASADQEENLMVTFDMQRCENVRRIWPYFRDRRIDDYQALTKRWRS
jgi:N-carbamoylputrescine amidase